MFRDRTFLALLLAGVLVVLMGSVRPDKIGGLQLEAFWGSKVRWKHCADIVVAGDSRVGIGVSPAEMNLILPGLRIYNFGFNANGYSGDYLEALPSLLAGRSDRATIVLGISPRSLSSGALSMNFFKMYREQADSDYFLVTNLGPVLRFLAPMSYDDAFKGLFPSENPAYIYREYQSDGWMASNQFPIRLGRKLDSYRKDFELHPVEPAIISGLLSAVSGWRERGILVYGFRVPSSAGMAELEDECSGFVEGEFSQAFVESGGVWLSFDQGGYSSYDGSHLTMEGARVFSRDLALKIKELWSIR